MMAIRTPTFIVVAMALFALGGLIEGRPRVTQIGYNSWGYVEFVNNELSVISTVDDPPKVRLAALHGKSLGAVSFNRLRPDGRQEEVALLQGKIDERYPNALGGEITLHLRTPDGVGDAAMVPVLTIRSDGITFHVPVSGLVAPSSFMRSGDGRFEFHLQGDRNLVGYDTSTVPWTPFWSSETQMT